MVTITTVASLERSLLAAARDLLSDRWFQATLCDAYFGFITFYVWVAYKERTSGRRVVWFILIMFLGNIAMAIYMLLQIARLPRGAALNSLLVRNDAKEQPALGA